jgi:hypothetical protein
MATIVNSPNPSGDSGMGFLIGVLVLVGFGFLFIIYGLPALRNMGPVKIEVATPEIVVPNSVDINVKPAQ